MKQHMQILQNKLFLTTSFRRICPNIILCVSNKRSTLAVETAACAVGTVFGLCCGALCCSGGWYLSAGWVMSGLSPADRPFLPIVWVRLLLLDEQSSDPVKDKHNGAITDCHFPSAPLRNPLPSVSAEKVTILCGLQHAAKQWHSKGLHFFLTILFRQMQYACVWGVVHWSGEPLVWIYFVLEQVLKCLSWNGREACMNIYLKTSGRHECFKCFYVPGGPTVYHSWIIFTVCCWPEDVGLNLTSHSPIPPYPACSVMSVFSVLFWIKAKGQNIHLEMDRCNHEKVRDFVLKLYFDQKSDYSCPNPRLRPTACPHFICFWKVHNPNRQESYCPWLNFQERKSCWNWIWLTVPEWVANLISRTVA